MVREEDKNLEWIENALPKSGKYINESRILLISDPKEPVLSKFTVEGTNPPTLISDDKQAVNIKYMRDKCRLKNNDINLEYTSRVLELQDPTDQYEAVHKKYCDDNSGK